MFVVLQKVGAGGAALAGGDHMLVGTVGVHDEDLIAIDLFARGLKDEPLAIRGPVGFGVLAAECQLLEIVEMSGGLCECRGDNDDERKPEFAQAFIV
jgi:hypothetical protein